MPVKESSDELNPTVAVPQSTVSIPKASRRPMDILALAIATCGVGFLPLIPGTFGSLLGVGVFLLLARVTSGRALIAVVLVSILAFTFSGIWAATRTEELSGRKDPGKVVVDEVAGQLIALFPLTFTLWSTTAVIVSFTLFRLFDIFKPYPANRFEAFKGGVGIMCDDLVAGFYGAVITSIIFVIL